MEKTTTFIQDCIAGKAHARKINDYIDAWHGSDSKLELHEYLGLTVEEYELYVAKGILAATILNYQMQAERRTGRTTCIIDQLIQTLFLKGSCTLFDHHWASKDDRSKKINFKRIADIIGNRLLREHCMEYGRDYIFDNKKSTFTLIKQNR